MSKNLLIVESPAKAKTIGKYLGPDFEVVASVGHIKDLPRKRLGVDIENDFTPEYEPIEGKQKVITELKKAAKGKDVVFLGPDPDREGEAIAWHIADSLGLEKHNFKRVLFHELTPQAIKAAINSPGALSRNRFDSQQTRRILDRLVGYLISPILWDKLKRGLSAGRVQSVALRILVERERAIQAFVAEEYWSVTGHFESEGLPFEAQLHSFGEGKIEPKNAGEADVVVKAVTGQEFTVQDVTAKDRKRSPYPPFTTSTLQQAAYHRLRLDPARTMKIAQELYEGVDLPSGSVGLITYMRTDSVRISPQAGAEAMDYVKGKFGPDYAPSSPNHYRNKKGAQDAHEAVRPTSVSRTPESLRGKISPHLWDLYDLIWRRFVASQMTPAVFKQTTANLGAKGYVFRATGSVITFNGYLALYGPDKEEDKRILPPLTQGQTLLPSGIVPKQHFTQPPARFNEATLVKELEERGIGRPSTYAAIISVLRDKEYVEGRKGQLKPSEMGMVVNDLLVDCFPKIMDVAFTADLEEDLDEIEDGNAPHIEVLKKLYSALADNLSTAKANMPNVKIAGIPVDVPCPSCHEAGQMSIRYGRNGFYLSCGNCGQTTDFLRDDKGVPQPVAPVSLSEEVFCEKCGKPMVVKKGRFGSFLACSGYPECRNTKPLTTDENGETKVSDETPPDLPQGLDPVCPNCGQLLLVKKTKRGTWFIACSGYPKCTYALSMPTGLDCPRQDCQGSILEKFSRRGPFYGCSEYPGCRVILRGTPLKEPCPECDSPYLVESNQVATKGQKLCPNPACPTNAHVEGGKTPPAWYEGKDYAKSSSARAAKTGKTGAKTTTRATKTTKTAGKTTTRATKTPKTAGKTTTRAAKTATKTATKTAGATTKTRAKKTAAPKAE
ncbi:MAG: type I DNA topoisomerase [Deltaproteobacteria bacterium]|jgi:DNA topoisomerase-1|nr:type I DNA topoisomerase [Deltaproteobacteria bacterium]